jgi:hypothetical protein
MSPISTYLAVSVILAWHLTLAVAHAQTLKPPDELTMEGSKEGPVGKIGAGVHAGFEIDILGVRKRADGALETDGIPIFVHRRVYDSDRKERFRLSGLIYFGPVGEGAMIPYIGAIYRIRSLEAPATITMSVVEPQWLPKAIEYPIDRFPVPVAGMIKFGDFRLRVLETALRKEESGSEFPEASVQLAKDFTRDKPTKLRAGDKIQIGIYSFRVDAIVPTNEDRKIVGWILLEPLEMIREKKEEK